MLKKRGFSFSFLSQIREERSGPTAYLTFDDGTLDQFEYAAPILEDEHVPGHFSILTGPWSGHYPVAHLLQVALSLEANGLFSPEPPPRSDPDADAVYWYESDFRRRQIKYYYNFKLRYDPACQKLEKVQRYMKKRFVTSKKLLNCPLIEYGVHGVRHIAFNGKKKYFDEEIAPAWQALLKRTERAVKVFTFPQRPQKGVPWERLEPQLLQDGWICAATTISGYYHGGFLVERIDAARLEDWMQGGKFVGQ